MKKEPEMVLSRHLSDGAEVTLRLAGLKAQVLKVRTESRDSDNLYRLQCAAGSCYFHANEP